MTPPCKDKAGRQINVGDYIAYGHALGRCAGLRIGKVLAIKYQEKEVGCGQYKELRPDWRITVIGVSDDWDHNAPELCSRKGTLMFPNRIIVLDSIPLIHRKLLENVT